MEALAAEKIKYRNRLFNPVVTLWAFLSQVLDVDKSCSNAVSRVIAWLASAGIELPATDTGGRSQGAAKTPGKTAKSNCWARQLLDSKRKRTVNNCGVVGLC